MSKTSPTQRSLEHLRKQGFTVAVVERWNQHARIRQDLFGFIDVLGVKDGETVAVQSTSWDNRLSRVNKIGSDELFERVSAVRKAGWRIVVHGWRKRGHRWEVEEIDCS